MIIQTNREHSNPRLSISIPVNSLSRPSDMLSTVNVNDRSSNIISSGPSKKDVYFRDFGWLTDTTMKGDASDFEILYCCRKKERKAMKLESSSVPETINVELYNEPSSLRQNGMQAAGV